MTSSDNKIILVVEDSQAALDQLRQRLEQEFLHEIITVRTYAEAEAVMCDRGPEIFVSVLDLNLPDASGGKVVDLAEQYEVPCIIFTSTVSQNTRKSILSRRVIDYVVKNRHAVDEVVFTIDRLIKNCESRVLVVDDSRSVRAYVRSLLELYMFQVSEAESGEQALDILSREHEIKLVITDYEMGDMNGVDLTSSIRTSTSRDELAIIGISSRSDKALSVQFIKQGANDYLNKPFEKEEFFCRVLKNVETVEDRHRLKELDDLKNRFLGMAVHDLRNPINAIKGFASIMISDKDDGMSDDHVELLGFIHMAAGEMDDLVNDLLDITVIESGRLELRPVAQEVAKIVEDRVHILRIPAQRKDIELEVRLRQVQATVDRDRLGQVIDNLLSNAIKYSPRNSTVTISLAKNGSNMVLTVADQGQGIPEEEQHRLFESFQKLSTQPTDGESSTGLGLAIVKKIVEAHEGTVSVDSVPGQGANFTVSIPLNV